MNLIKKKVIYVYINQNQKVVYYNLLLKDYIH